MIKVGVVGGTGYTGVDLLRLLAAHPQADVTAITSRGEAGCDCVFSAIPNGAAMSQAVQSMDLMFGFPETQAFKQLAVVP